MSLADPRALADFIDLLPIKSRRWREHRNDELAGQGSGNILAVELATALWAADVEVDWSRWPEARRLQAMVRSFQGPMKTFLMTNPIAEFPAFDPDGSILGAAEVALLAIDDDNERVSFSGLPAGYQLGWGDFGEIVFGENPERRFVFEIHGTATADSGGETGLVTIGPHVWPGVAEGMAVNLIRPAAKFFIVPGSLQEGATRRSIVDGWSFSVLQRP